MRLLLALLLIGSPLLADVVISVSPDGTLQSPAAARDHVRELRRQGEQGPIRIEFASGTYFLEEPLTLGTQDSGLKTGPTTYAAAAQAQVRWTGGRRITGWQPAQDGLWKIDLPEVREGRWYFEQLWINGRRAVRARTPNAVEGRTGAVGGYFHARAPAHEELFPDLKQPHYEAFVARPADFAVVASIPEAERADLLLTILQTWSAGQCRIQALNPASHAIRIAGATRYPFVEKEPDQRWYIENFRAALDAPGEWFLVRDGTLFYYPLPGEDLTRAEVIAPVTEKLLTLDGVNHVAFHGLHFEYTHHRFGPTGHHDGQAAGNVGAVIELDRCQHVHFEDCAINHTGGYGLWFRDACADSSLRHSHLSDLGGGGVRIGSIKTAADASLPRRITVDDCLIHGGGRLFPSACGVFLAHAADCVVTHCDISDFFYTGISAGWVWGYRHSPSKRNRIDFNHIHHLGWGVLSDMGGFYGLGRSEGTTVSHNHVHDISSYRYGGWGLYTDEGSTGVTLENNLVHDTSEATFHQHYGKWNRVSNNIFAYGRKAQIQRSRPEPHASFAYENNIVIYDSPVLLDGTERNWQVGTYEMRNNLYWNSAGLPVRFLDADLTEWQAKTGHEEGSRVADPLFVNATARDFRLKPESPAFAMGFQAFDPAQAGLRGQGEWRQKAAALTFPRFWEQSKPWPRPEYAIEENFEHMGLGQPLLPNQEIHWQNQGDQIVISEDQAVSGKRSLKFTDAPHLTPAWDPHLVLKPQYSSGLVTIRFQLRHEPNAKLFMEWRSAGQHYRTGPSLLIEKNRIRERRRGQTLDLPADTWIHIEMQARLGTGTWTWRMTSPGQPPQEWKDLPCDPDWTELAWFGIVSTAEEKVSFWIDDLEIHRQP